MANGITRSTRKCDIYFGVLPNIRAMTVRNGYEKSPVEARNYVLLTDIIGTAAKGVVPTDAQVMPIAFSDKTAWPARQLDYMVNTLTMGPGMPAAELEQAGANLIGMKAKLLQEFHAVPSVFLTCEVPELFDYDAGGIYASAGVTESRPTSYAGRPAPSPAYDPLPDPLGKNWERKVNFGIAYPDGTPGLHAAGRLQMSGDGSLQEDITPKHGFRIKFGQEQTQSVNHAFFPDTNRTAFSGMLIKNPSSNCWPFFLTAPSTGETATYCNDYWARGMRRAMGYQTARWRYVHLFLNGLYWGVYNISERTDDEWLGAYYGAGNWDIIGPVDNPTPTTTAVVAEKGTTTAWSALIAACTSLKTGVAQGLAPATLTARYNAVKNQLAVDDYIDYLIINTFMGNADWPHKNWKAARKLPAAVNGIEPFRFVVQDAEWAFHADRAEEVTLEGQLNGSGATQVHSLLSTYSEYKTAFSNRVKRAFAAPDSADPTKGMLSNTGGTDLAVSMYQEQMNAFSQVLECESIRWGRIARPADKPFPWRRAHWVEATGKVTDPVTGYIAKRRPYFLTQLQTLQFYVP
jgi:hypothetical protein